MKSFIHFAAPNIVPGVNLTAARFEEMYAWITTLAADSIQTLLSPYHFGLMIPHDGKAALTLEKVGDKLVLSRCCGITPQGSLIGLFDALQQPMILDITKLSLHSQERYAVMMEVLHQPRRAFGQESLDLPLRPLYSMPTYQLQVQPLDQAIATRSDGFCIGILAMKTGEWELEEYIPPCLHVGANPRLKESYVKYVEALHILLKEQPKIILQTDSYQEKSMIELREFTMQLGSFLASRMFQYRNLSDYANPFQLFELWAAFAQLASFLLQCFTDRPGFYNLLNENTRGVNGVFLTPQSFDTAIQDLVGLQYNPNHILPTLNVTDHFLNMIVPIFKALSIGTLRPVSNTGTWSAPEEVKHQSYTW